MKKCKCGLCRESSGERFVGTRKGLRKHLREEHHITKEIKNKEEKNRKVMQRWWKEEEI